MEKIASELRENLVRKNSGQCRTYFTDMYGILTFESKEENSCVAIANVSRVCLYASPKYFFGFFFLCIWMKS